MNRILYGLVGLLVLAPLQAMAQATPISAEVVAACAGKSYLVGDAKPLTQTQTGNTCTSSTAAAVTPATPISSAALVANQIIITGAHQLLSFDVAADSTLSGAAWWLMIYNATSAPADGAVTPVKCYALPSGATGFNGAFSAPISFSTGIVIGVSTTGCFTKTASTHAFISGDYQ